MRNLVYDRVRRYRWRQRCSTNSVNPTRPTIGQSNPYFAYAMIALFLARRMVHVHVLGAAQ